jgi:phosphoglycerate dehydrogenase-like enzyme
MYQKVILKDKVDLLPHVLQKFPNVNVLGAYEKVNIENTDDIKVLSVKFSKVGKTTFEKYKNLEWVVCRSHGVDMINLKECKTRNIGVVALSPTAEPCAQWVVSWITGDKNVLIFGNGAISREIQKRITNVKVINSSTPKDDIADLVKWADTIISTIPLTEDTKYYFNRQFFNLIEKPITFISLSRGELFDNGAILDFSVSGNLKLGIFDMLTTDSRNLLVNQPNIRYTEHVAWSYNQPMENGKVDGGYVNSQFADNLKDVIDSCLRGNVNHPHLNREQSLWF